MSAEFVLTVCCPEAVGLVHAVTGVLAGCGCDIVESRQFDDPGAGELFLRIQVRAPDSLTADRLRAAFAPVAGRHQMRWQLHRRGQRARVLVLVSKYGHCLNDLLFRARSGTSPIQIAGVVSNHDEFRALTESYGIGFHHIPVTPDGKADAESRLVALHDELQVDLVVLARYMQILSGQLCRRLAGRAINIHHSFLPSFKGGRPYHQAHARGVKLVGATAHYVTADLDEGPIIEQDVVRVDHSCGPAELAAAGRDVEALVLARAVTWHAEHRVLLNGNRTVVFR
ncbi:MAG: formyltetrahydrofolate deformylase [Streptosporangiaceae bacterium]